MAGFTVTQLQELEAALATGARVIKYRDNEYTLRSLDDMLRLREIIKRDLGQSKNRRRRYTSSYDKNL